MAPLPALLLASALLLAGSALFNRYDAGSGGTTTTTHLHFYMHDDYTGLRPTAMHIVSGRSLGTPAVSDNTNSTVPSTSAPRQFGDIVALNNALTEGPGCGSAWVGTAQGFAVRVSEGGVVSDLSMHLVLGAGDYSGSSLAVKGRIDMELAVRESMIIGGTGQFRLAQGYMLSKSYDYSLAAGGIVEIDLYVQVQHD
ncbi:hypothetical protein CFC21_055953 [Triticum aestivum]|uniref:Dirigent protein n=2 Tax=Triticum aestivum TaxID=4565 RepID=A0A3B6IK10_WHEAT|nr:dirigent protein 1-like [Triticum aestivum]KAF7046971.1 hypothetical protein CFC21_055953 [Triticum aestivum]